jgi:hypothetical protein
MSTSVIIQGKQQRKRKVEVVIVLFNQLMNPQPVIKIIGPVVAALTQLLHAIAMVAIFVNMQFRRLLCIHPSFIQFDAVLLDEI